jgi:hypothetical protein
LNDVPRQAMVDIDREFDPPTEFIAACGNVFFDSRNANQIVLQLFEGTRVHE